MSGCKVPDKTGKNEKEKKSKVNEVLNAPGNYLKSTVGQIEKAKETKKLVEEKQSERMNIGGFADE